MAQSVKSGVMARTLAGNERTGGARVALSTGRWAAVLDQVRGRFSKLVLLNLLLLIFCIPLVIVFLTRTAYILAGGQSMPFSGWMFVGFPAFPSLAGVAERVLLNVDVLYGALMVAGLVVAGIGISGGLNVVRTMIRRGGEFTLRDFWQGMGANIGHVLPAAAICGIPAYLLLLAVDYSRYLLAVGQGNAAGLIVGIVFAVIGMVLLALLFLWELSVGANYKVGFFKALRTALFAVFRLFPFNLFYAALVALPLALLFFGSFLQTIGFVLMFLFGIIYMLLVWMNYSQWAFDNLVGEPEAAPAERAAAPQADKAQADKATALEESLEQATRLRSDLASRPVKPIDDGMTVYELPASFTRADLQRARASREELAADAKAYAEAHKNDEKYVVYNAQFEKLEQEKLEREREAEKAAKKGKKKARGGEGQ